MMVIHQHDDQKYLLNLNFNFGLHVLNVTPIAQSNGCRRRRFWACCVV